MEAAFLRVGRAAEEAAGLEQERVERRRGRAVRVQEGQRAEARAEPDSRSAGVEGGQQFLREGACVARGGGVVLLALDGVDECGADRRQSGQEAQQAGAPGVVGAVVDEQERERPGACGGRPPQAYRDPRAEGAALELDLHVSVAYPLPLAPKASRACADCAPGGA